MVRIVMTTEQEALKYANGGINIEDNSAYGFLSLGLDCNTPGHICNRFSENSYTLKCTKTYLLYSSESEKHSKDFSKKASFFTTPLLYVGLLLSSCLPPLFPKSGKNSHLLSPFLVSKTNFFPTFWDLFLSPSSYSSYRRL
ncbi:hypothetical protein PHYBLDRAFT_60928 [Phycomyces blakesleeanus NRRL 1555(-)]|uniref:Uncharacterized protein n=1 Tax=Phycomyces blakesleeanus (strain ATCC 8743b / DSM 1359 / FGSC 10004 / NBRC 33097 / NRRL 1555) TaxID=763407 RepID=A0A162UTB3_PHYB8|nr:hypothetical protein PHYBLDRAFT_60928 [Phycomyces blakesleeanus NRRL 1555(-)]OAD77803.1 hypothetical protein PHYBLDRAFT_60928 [Phycomyces blakesleeanus NRRL 1555(-)]|eukprot:XP_018295843.1 hypothetical protein PHYBLDRAFT_60928 [Phycomyces blakesleeanus NRRL 1555(-)]